MQICALKSDWNIISNGFRFPFNFPRKATYSSLFRVFHIGKNHIVVNYEIICHSMFFVTIRIWNSFYVFDSPTLISWKIIDYPHCENITILKSQLLQNEINCKIVIKFNDLRHPNFFEKRAIWRIYLVL